MGDPMYVYGRSTCSSSNSASSPPDDLSVFLQQIFLRSSSSSASSSTSIMAHMGKDGQSSLPPTSMAGLCSTLATGENLNSSEGPTLFQDGISAVDSANGGCGLGGVRLSTSTTPNVRGTTAANVSSSSVGVSENETDEYDCESEENAEALVEELPVKLVPPRSSSKRSRAAEVHNLSEKRRRSRINEKMKALQNLIPNSNKTDKASMLDEAIEYLKQLQLQVQMLSMRNGMTFPMCLPGTLPHMPLSHMRMELGEEHKPLPFGSILPLQQENLVHGVHGLVNQCTTSNPPPVPSLSYILNTDTSDVDSSIQAHLRPFQLQRTSEGMSREDTLHPQHFNAIHQCTNTSASVSLSFNAQMSGLKDRSTFETCIAAGRDHQAPELAARKTRQNLVISSSQLSR